MIYLREFSNHRDYSDIMNNGGLQLEVPSVSYCDDVDDVHFNQYNVIKLFSGNLETPETIEVYLNKDGSEKRTVDLLVRDKWYYIYLPSDKALYGTNDYSSVTKAYFSVNVNNIPWREENCMISINSKEVSFKGSNTSNVTDMSFMFNGCTTLTSLDVSSFDTSKVTNMSGMFGQCAINSIDVSSFNTSKVTDMTRIFINCDNLTSLDLSNFDTSNITDMHHMFSGCANLTSLTLSNFNTSNVTNMYYMFEGCASLESLDLSGFDTSKVTDMGGMFDGCSKLSTIRMKNCSEATVNKIKEQLKADDITGATIVTT